MVYVAFFHFGVQSVSCYLLRLLVCNTFVRMVNVKSDSVYNLVRPELIYFFRYKQFGTSSWLRD